ncbi:MAG: alpha-hydroxy-acid oxidizing protein, partial [Candidatus Diapherotrites archaeon]|nr:alpha-hydroxy-acid oxidizing protein [Candidatus Diapherotrites archaeon]
IQTPFTAWGIPTAASVVECAGALPTIATGGIRNGLQAAKALALGANLVGFALPALKSLEKKTLEKDVESMIQELRIAMFLTGSRNVNQLKGCNVVIMNRLREWCHNRGIDNVRYALRDTQQAVV